MESCISNPIRESVKGKKFKVFIYETNNGKFCAGLNISGDPLSTQTKKFFPDRKWTGPIFEGYANIIITKEFDRYGFFVGSMELLEEQDPLDLANWLADQFLSKAANAFLFKESSRVVYYQGERGSAYLIECGGTSQSPPLYFYVSCNAGMENFNLPYKALQNGSLTSISTVLEFIANNCYGRENFNLSEEIPPIKLANRFHPLPWQIAMSFIRNKLEQFSAQENTDADEILEILYNARYIIPVGFADEMFFKSYSGIPSQLFSLTAHELQTILRFIKSQNASAEKRLADKIKSGKVHILT